MRTYTINGESFEYDDKLTYLDFYVDEKGGHLIQLDWDKLLTAIQEGKGKPEHVQEEMILLDRWIRDVPRKRFYRKMVKDGMSVLSGEYWFENLPDNEAEEIFTNLLNSAVVARKFLMTFLPDVAEKCQQDGRSHPADKYLIDP